MCCSEGVAVLIPHEDKLSKKSYSISWPEAVAVLIPHDDMLMLWSYSIYWPEGVAVLIPYCSKFNGLCPSMYCSVWPVWLLSVSQACMMLRWIWQICHPTSNPKEALKQPWTNPKTRRSEPRISFWIRHLQFLHPTSSFCNPSEILLKYSKPRTLDLYRSVFPKKIQMFPSKHASAFVF
jgi:hypothetical protein